MKRLIFGIAAIAVAGVGIGLYASRPGNRPAAPVQPASESTAGSVPDDTQALKPVVVRPPRARQDSAAAAESSRSATPASPAWIDPKGDDSLAFNQAIDTLVSPQSGFVQKQEAWKQLRETGKLDQAISELEQRVVKDAGNAACPAALGQAYLQKCATIQDIPDQGILAMKADKAFTAALNLDPSNWDARFTKAVAMSYWPPQLNKSQEVIGNFETLVQQQEAQSPQPQFAQSYVWLGDQYQKAGRATDARAIWQRGATLYPGDTTLPKRLSQPAGQ